ncbi:MAG TPA: universal stress protein [Pyrinomonadaceae bacterium]|nr:universal stress protein [Pyrinomonadaceae bacterium]
MKILIATDGTRYGEAAVQMLAKFNLGPSDEIKIISVVDLALPLAIDIYGGYLPDTTDLEKNARENAWKIVEDAANKLRGINGRDVPIAMDVLFGSPDGQIVETAEQMGANLIVLGSHGYKQWERLLLGSVSDSVVHHAHCSVLVVRDEGPRND